MSCYLDLLPREILCIIVDYATSPSGALLSIARAVRKIADVSEHTVLSDCSCGYMYNSDEILDNSRHELERVKYLSRAYRWYSGKCENPIQPCINNCIDPYMMMLPRYQPYEADLYIYIAMLCDVAMYKMSRRALYWALMYSTDLVFTRDFDVASVGECMMYYMHAKGVQARCKWCKDCGRMFAEISDQSLTQFSCPNCHPCHLRSNGNAVKGIPL